MRREPLQMKDKNGNVTQAFTLRAFGNPTQLTTLGTTVSLTYDSSGNPTRQIGPAPSTGPSPTTPTGTPDDTLKRTVPGGTVNEHHDLHLRQERPRRDTEGPAGERHFLHLQSHRRGGHEEGPPGNVTATPTKAGQPLQGHPPDGTSSLRLRRGEPEDRRDRPGRPDDFFEYDSSATR